MKALMPGEPLSENPDRTTAKRRQAAGGGGAFGREGFSPMVRGGWRRLTSPSADGEFLTLIGPSGCGKSTLLKLIANLIEPSDGRPCLWWRGEFGQVGQDGRRFAFVFQEPTLMPWARVDANVRLPLELADVASAKMAPAVGGGDRACRLVEICPAFSASIVRRHEDAGLDRAGTRDQSESPADGRTFRRA